MKEITVMTNDEANERMEGGEEMRRKNAQGKGEKNAIHEK